MSLVGEKLEAIGKVREEGARAWKGEAGSAAREKTSDHRMELGSRMGD